MVPFLLLTPSILSPIHISHAVIVAFPFLPPSPLR
jgi:hypothetical protein